LDFQLADPTVVSSGVELVDLMADSLAASLVASSEYVMAVLSVENLAVLSAEMKVALSVLLLVS